MKFEIISRGTGFRLLRGNSDLFGVILSYLGAEDLCKLALVCRHLLEDSMTAHLWKAIIATDFISSEYEGKRIRPKLKKVCLLTVVGGFRWF